MKIIDRHKSGIETHPKGWATQLYPDTWENLYNTDKDANDAVKKKQMQKKQRQKTAGGHREGKSDTERNYGKMGHDTFYR